MEVAFDLFNIYEKLSQAGGGIFLKCEFGFSYYSSWVGSCLEIFGGGVFLMGSFLSGQTTHSEGNGILRHETRQPESDPLPRVPRDRDKDRDRDRDRGRQKYVRESGQRQKNRR